VSDAGSGSRIIRLRRTILLLLEEIYFETACVDQTFENRLKKTGGKRLFLGYLARNSGVAANSA
jgi:hypothetical protein